MKRISLLTFAASSILLIGIFVLSEVREVQLDRACVGFLKRASNANTIPLAIGELEKAVVYIEENELDQGSTEAFYWTPDCDLVFWHENLRASLDELKSLPSDVDPLTASNQLIKLRETIIDGDRKRPRVAVPPNFYVYPFQFAYRVATIAGLAGLLIGFVALAIASERNKSCVSRSV